MAAPVKSFVSEAKKGLRITVWENAGGRSYTVEKSFKRKGESEFTRQKIALFPEELTEMGKLLTAAIRFENNAEVEAAQRDPYEKQAASPFEPPPLSFKDEDLIF